MQRIETRTDLIQFICESIPQHVIARACHTGTVQVLGGFDSIPPSGQPGWIVSVTSIHGRTWLVTVIANDHRHIFQAGTTESIPWESYMCPSRHQQLEGYSIYFGDNPDQARIAWTRAKIGKGKGE